MPLAQAVDDRLELSGFHSGTTSLDLVKADSQDSMARRFAGRRPPICGGVVLESTFLMKRTNNALVLHFGRHRAARGDESGAPVADHQAHALEAAFDHGPNELLPAVHVLPHALGDADDLATSLRVDSDGDQDAHVLHVPAP